MIEIDSPFDLKISFEKLIQQYETIANDKNHPKNEFAQKVLVEVNKVNGLKVDIYDFDIIDQNKETVKLLFSELFPEILTHNEIKAVAIPFLSYSFNHTERFKKIIKGLGFEQVVNIRDFSEHQFYIMNCCMVINSYFKKPIDFSSPLFYDIPDENGIMRHYRILYNADFLEVIPTEKSIMLQEDDIMMLLDNYDDINLWKKYFPNHSWILKGFGIVNLFDATIESAVSNLKSNLLKSETQKAEIEHLIEPILRSFFKIPDLIFGHIIYDSLYDKLCPPFFSYAIKSYILDGLSDTDVIISPQQLIDIYQDQKYLSFADLESETYDLRYQKLVNQLRKKGFKSFVLAPIINQKGELLGALELHSKTKSALNSVNAHKIDFIIGFVQDAVEKFHLELSNNIDLVIQKEYSSIHESVYWKFKEEATKYFRSTLNNENYQLKEIVFKDVYPLFGQVDIKGSSEQRNHTIIEDIKHQLEWLLNIFNVLKEKNNLLILEQKIFEIESFEKQLAENLKADFEQQIQKFLAKEIHPLLKSLITEGDLLNELNLYFENIESKSGLMYKERKKFDQALTIINKKLANVLDEKQKDAQKIYPHYYERFKTDGIEHNLYIGQSINPDIKFDDIFLKNLRLWQFKTICEMELEHFKFKNELPFPLEITSLILVMNLPISIRFRMDEKRFDVDGTYNARYEVVKKRIDKSRIKNSDERIVQMGKITVVFSVNNEKNEYLEYANYLIHKGIISDVIEEFEVEDLQGISGLKAIRVEVLHPKEIDTNEGSITIDEFIEKHN